MFEVPPQKRVILAKWMNRCQAEIHDDDIKKVKENFVAWGLDNCSVNVELIPDLAGKAREQGIDPLALLKQMLEKEVKPQD